MFSAFNTFGKLGALASSVARAWSPLALWPDGISSAGMWISPRDLTSQWKDSAGTTPVVTPGTVADSSNPVGLALDIRAGATVLTDPGNHMLQSTSAARPLLSARVNLLTKTEDLSATGWANITSPTAYVANKIVPSATTNYMGKRYSLTSSDKPISTFSAYLKEGDTGVHAEIFVGPEVTAIINLSTWATLSSMGASVALGEYDANGYRKVSITSLSAITMLIFIDIRCTSSSESNQTFAGDGSKGYYCTKVQFNTGAATTYQAVDTDSSYSSTGFPIAQLYDGVDDGMATAAFSAGTLTSGMDCMIAVRRDSAAACVAGLYNGIADATKFFGMTESGSGSGCVGSGAGTPTVWVDGVQLSGGTAVTRGTLHTALTVGDYHILEFRGLDLSTWTAAGFGLYTSYVFPGPRGDILLYPSTASTEDKDAARQYLADYYGVTLA